ncbi:methylmalonic aciduria and homocystinuria type D protein [Roseofilum casamattae]|uniref:Methylmalonic aciduria and homocystinuria type D protein n=1 Tax=Roseofilum casamattae BLCC-M143 TaxID=3022442 RepID=A0ABT7BXF2_9CYAN|nr:methylmalonic aciduria and homocystinuria type D protein [Roseofilum casamattae]MDJ1183869.1 methylmalonic aciduria and homocystinuria type D protein [Roseofilum casamattae BLCC-M143]
MTMEISIHPPHDYLQQNLSELMPSCPTENVWTIIVLQQANLPLTEDLPGVPEEKDRLRDKFIGFVEAIGDRLQHLSDGQNPFTDGFDPRTGTPLHSTPGSLTHSDVTAVRTALGYDLIPGECAAISHPRWGTAVYPSVILSTAERENIERAIATLS